MNEPVGRFGSFTPDRARMIASATACTASSWPTTRWCSTSSRRSSFSCSLGQPGHRDAGPHRDDLGDLLRVPTSRSSRCSPCFSASRAPRLELALEVGLLREAQLRGAVEVVGALGLLDVADLLQLRPQLLDPLDRLPFGIPLGAHGVGLAAQVGQFTASWSSRARGSVLLLGECRLLDLQPHHLAGDLVELGGMESISVRSRAHASSTRSMALSGRNWSVR